MTQRDRDRLVALKKAKKRLITQRQAAEEIGQSERHIRRLLKKLKRQGDQAVVHALRGRPSNRKLDEKIKGKALEILGREVYRGFGPTLASEYLAEQTRHSGEPRNGAGLDDRRQAVAARKQQVRRSIGGGQRRSASGELVQWDTSEHEWLEERGRNCT